MRDQALPSHLAMLLHVMPPAVAKSLATYRFVPDTANAETLYPPLNVEPRSVHVLPFHLVRDGY